MKKRRLKQKLTPYLLLLPFLLLMTVFCAGIVNAVLQGLGYLPAFGLTKLSFQYFKEILSSGRYLQSIGYSLWIAGVSSVLAVILGILLCACLLFASKRKSPVQMGVTNTLLKLPIFIPHTVVAPFVISLFSQTGLLSRLCFHLGFITEFSGFPSLLYDKGAVGVILAYLWKEIPFVWFFTMTLMANISGKYDEAAQGLGASKIKSFLFVTLPMCRPTILSAFFIVFTYAFGAYELPFLLGATLPKALPVEAYIEYTHPDLLHRPYAMALNVVMIAVSLAASFLYFKQLEKKHENLL